MGKTNRKKRPTEKRQTRMVVSEDAMQWVDEYGVGTLDGGDYNVCRGFGGKENKTKN